MEKYVTYFDTRENTFVIEKTEVKYNDWNRPTIKGGYIINKDSVFENLESAIKSLRNSSYKII